MTAAPTKMPMMDDARRKTLAFVVSLSDDEMCAWPDEAFSPIAWHLGHVAFTEAHWALKRCVGVSEHSVPYAERFAQNGRAKSKRADGYKRDALFAYMERVRAQVRKEWTAVESELGAEYLDWFLACHEHQHRETMKLVLALAMPDRGAAFERAANAATALSSVTSEPREFGGEGELGSDAENAYDNERPSMRVNIPDFALATAPVSCGEWAAFMDDGGYDERELWCDDGWAFTQTLTRKMPRAWRRADRENAFVLLAPEGPQPVTSRAAVWGVSWYEANAYARWAGASLPSEAEWELAARQGLSRTGEAWEWCACAFEERPGFSAHPYPGYSKPYFDGKHRVLRGGSFATDPAIARPEFRNWFVPETRQVFAGLRLRFAI